MRAGKCLEVIEEIQTSLRPLAEAKGLSFSVEISGDELVVWTDRRALHQILLNLANNSLKFTDEGNVQIRVSEPASNSEHLVEFAVIDTGKASEGGPGQAVPSIHSSGRFRWPPL
jgi:two-component system sensor histidine kinase/response regulator